MLAFLVRRTGTSLLALVGVVFVVFVIVRVLPGDPAAVRAGQYASPEELARIRARYGLDQPLWTQLGQYLRELGRLDLGVSVQTDQNVREEILRRLPASLELAVCSVLAAALIAFPLGLAAAVRRGTALDVAVRVYAVVGSSTPLFWLGLLLIYFTAFRFHLFPGPVGRLPIGLEGPPRVTGLLIVDAALHAEPRLVWAALSHLALPVATMGFVLSAPILKILRSAMIEVLDSPYVRTARSMGVPPIQILLADGLRNALIPVTTSLGIALGYMLGGNIIIETLFAWPGIGKYAYDALRVNDLQALQGFVITVGLLYITLNFLVDVLYAWIDPRIRLPGLLKE